MLQSDVCKQEASRWECNKDNKTERQMTNMKLHITDNHLTKSDKSKIKQRGDNKN